MQGTYAHSLAGQPEATWESLRDHLSGTSDAAGCNAAPFGWEAAGRVMGGLHDIGKVSAQFQAYIRATAAPNQPGSGGDHSTAGARVAVQRYGDLGRVMAFGIAGHHAGLADAEELDRRLDEKRTALPPFAGWDAHAGPLPGLQEVMRGLRKNPHKGFSQAFLTRMLFSCLVDADFIGTEAFYAAAEGTTVERGGYRTVVDLLARLRATEAARAVAASELNTLRAEILAHAVAKAALNPGVFTLTVPTGGGKTLTSLSFALEHAQRHGLRRVVYVIPYTSIIEQTAEVFREALGTTEDVLEHHASFDWEGARRGKGCVDDTEGNEGLAKLRRAAENWDAPVVVTTAVQFFESLFGARTSQCRKLHNLARSVIVLDEAQTLPLRLLQPCLAALDELRLNYGASVVLCTATQPAIRKGLDEFKGGLEVKPEYELAPDPPRLYARLRRVRVERMPGPVDDATVAARFAEQPQMLCIVNSRRHAFELFGRIAVLEGAVHLSTFMCPRHRRAVLARMREQLKAGLPVRLVATSLIEAGVDISFPEVWRALAGLDSIAQAAGRCNREGELLPELGRVVVFTPANDLIKGDLKVLAEATEGVFRGFQDPLTLDAVRAYFRTLYWNKGVEAFDKVKLDKQDFSILKDIDETKDNFRFNFARIARAFRMIEDAMEPVIVPWQADVGDTHAKGLLDRIANPNRPKPSIEDLRALQQYTVPVPPKQRKEWLAQGVLRPVHRALGEALLMFENTSLYDAATGLRVFDPVRRTAEDNIMGP